jgi:hypothetical protein
MSDDENLEIVSDEEDSMYESSSEEGEKCYYCNCYLLYEDNEFFIEDENSYCCQRCWNDIHEY